MQRQFDVVIERDSERYYVASVPQLPGCHTQAKSLDEVMVRIREAIEVCLEDEGSDRAECGSLVKEEPARFLFVPPHFPIECVR